MNDDLQIKPVGSTPVGNTGTPAASQSQPVTTIPAGNQASSASGTSPVNPVTPAPTTTAPAAPINLDQTAAPNPAPAKPTNQRAFNLESDADTAASASAKPEKYAIPKSVQEKYPDLVELIKSTESMDDEEREYWFQILPVMTQDQIDKFKVILSTEKQQLAELDQEYEQELNKLNDKHLIEWKEFESKEKSRVIKEAEAVSQQEEKHLEEDLLAKLSDV